MFLPLPLPQYTLLHVVLSLVGIIAGLVVTGGLIAGRRLDGWSLTFLVTTVLTNAGGYLFPFVRLLPSHIVGGLSLLLLLLVAIARYGKKLEGGWNRVFVLGTVAALYFNVFVLVTQLFAKFPLLIVLAPTQQSPVFGATQLVVLALFVVLGRSAVRGAPTAGQADASAGAIPFDAAVRRSA
ncbi:MAG: hypothetical protein U0133_00415 [Gemmatimonadales bacterium]